MNKISEEKERKLAKRLLEEMEKLAENEAVLIHSKRPGKISRVRILPNRLEVPKKEFWPWLKGEEEGWEGVYFLDSKAGKNTKINALEDFFLIPFNSPWGEAAQIVAKALQFSTMVEVKLINLKEGVS